MRSPLAERLSPRLPRARRPTSSAARGLSRLSPQRQLKGVRGRLVVRPTSPEHSDDFPKPRCRTTGQLTQRSLRRSPTVSFLRQGELVQSSRICSSHWSSFTVRPRQPRDWAMRSRPRSTRTCWPQERLPQRQSSQRHHTDSDRLAPRKRSPRSSLRCRHHYDFGSVRAGIQPCLDFRGSSFATPIRLPLLRECQLQPLAMQRRVFDQPVKGQRELNHPERRECRLVERYRQTS